MAEQETALPMSGPASYEAVHLGAHKSIGYDDLQEISVSLVNKSLTQDLVLKRNVGSNPTPRTKIKSKQHLLGGTHP